MWLTDNEHWVLGWKILTGWSLYHPRKIGMKDIAALHIHTKAITKPILFLETKVLYLKGLVIAQNLSRAIAHRWRIEAVQHITSQDIHKWQAIGPNLHCLSRSYIIEKGITKEATVMSAVAKLASRRLVMDRRRRNLVTTTRTRTFPTKVVVTSIEQMTAPNTRSPTSPPVISLHVKPEIKITCLNVRI